MTTIFFTIVAIFLFLLLVYVVFVSCIPFREGYQIGRLMEFDRTGILKGTWEGYIQKGEYEGSGSTFYFSVKDHQKEAIEKLLDWQGKVIKLVYEERYGVLRWRGDTKYFAIHAELETASYFLDTNAEPLSPNKP